MIYTEAQVKMLYKFAFDGEIESLSAALNALRKNVKQSYPKGSSLSDS